MGEVEPPPRASERARRLEAERHALAVSRAMHARSKVLPTLVLLAALGPVTQRLAASLDAWAVAAAPTARELGHPG